jgi:hypothetical protein
MTERRPPKIPDVVAHFRSTGEIGGATATRECFATGQGALWEFQDFEGGEGSGEAVLGSTGGSRGTHMPTRLAAMIYDPSPLLPVPRSTFPTKHPESSGFPCLLAMPSARAELPHVPVMPFLPDVPRGRRVRLSGIFPNVRATKRLNLCL